MRGDPSRVFASGNSPELKWGWGLGALGCPGCGSCPALDIHGWSLPQLSEQGWHQGEQDIQGVMPLAGGGAAADVSHHLLVFWGRIGVGGGRHKKHSGGRGWMLSGLAASPLCSLLLIFTGLFSKKEVGGKETQQVLLTKLHVLLNHLNPDLSFWPKPWLNMESWTHEGNASGRGVSLMHQAGEVGYVTSGHSAVTDPENCYPGKKFFAFVLQTSDLFERAANFGILWAYLLYGHQIHGKCGLYFCWGTSHNVFHVASHTSRLLFLISKITFYGNQNLVQPEHWTVRQNGP